MGKSMVTLASPCQTGNPSLIKASESAFASKPQLLKTHWAQGTVSLGFINYAHRNVDIGDTGDTTAHRRTFLNSHPPSSHKLPGEVFLNAKCATLQNIWANIWQIPPALTPKLKKPKMAENMTATSSMSRFLLHPIIDAHLGHGIFKSIVSIPPKHNLHTY